MRPRHGAVTAACPPGDSPRPVRDRLEVRHVALSHLLDLQQSLDLQPDLRRTTVVAVLDDLEAWYAMREQLTFRREARRQQLRFRKDPAAYLAALEEVLLKTSLPP